MMQLKINGIIEISSNTKVLILDIDRVYFENSLHRKLFNHYTDLLIGTLCIRV